MAQSDLPPAPTIPAGHPTPAPPTNPPTRSPEPPPAAISSALDSSTAPAVPLPSVRTPFPGTKHGSAPWAMSSATMLPSRIEAATPSGEALTAARATSSDDARFVAAADTVTAAAAPASEQPPKPEPALPVPLPDAAPLPLKAELLPPRFRRVACSAPSTAHTASDDGNARESDKSVMPSGLAPCSSSARAHCNEPAAELPQSSPGRIPELALSSSPEATSSPDTRGRCGRLHALQAPEPAPAASAPPPDPSGRAGPDCLPAEPLRLSADGRRDSLPLAPSEGPGPGSTPRDGSALAAAAEPAVAEPVKVLCSWLPPALPAEEGRRCHLSEWAAGCFHEVPCSSATSPCLPSGPPPGKWSGNESEPPGSGISSADSIRVACAMWKDSERRGRVQLPAGDISSSEDEPRDLTWAGHALADVARRGMRRPRASCCGRREGSRRDSVRIASVEFGGGVTTAVGAANDAVRPPSGRCTMALARADTSSSRIASQAAAHAVRTVKSPDSDAAAARDAAAAAGVDSLAASRARARPCAAPQTGAARGGRCCCAPGSAVGGRSRRRGVPAVPPVDPSAKSPARSCESVLAKRVVPKAGSEAWLLLRANPPPWALLGP